MTTLKRMLSLCLLWPLSLASPGQSPQMITLTLSTSAQVLPGDLVRLNVAGVSAGTVVIGSPLFSELPDLPAQAILSSAPYVFSFFIPAGLPAGDYPFYALVSTTGTRIQSNSVTVHLASVDAVTALAPDPSGFILRFLGAARTLKIYGVVAQGQTDLSGDTDVVCTSANPAVVAIASPCTAIAVGTGSTSINISYRGLAKSVTARVEPSGVRGDFNGDGVIDQYDVQLLTLQLNKPLLSGGDARDLNGDGKIDALDARIEATLCTHPRCAVQ